MHLRSLYKAWAARAGGKPGAVRKSSKVSYVNNAGNIVIHAGLHGVIHLLNGLTAANYEHASSSIAWGTKTFTL